jgi:hypothetical protein
MDDEPKQSRRAFIEQVPHLSAAFTALALLLSVTHDIGYFYVVGYKWLTIQTAGDYLSSAIGWLPFTLLSCFVGSIVGYGLTRLRPSRAKRPASTTLVVVVGLALLAFVYFFSYPQPEPLISIMIGGAWIVIASAMLPPVNEQTRKFAGSIIVITIGPTIAALFYALGVLDGYDDVSGKLDRYVVEIRQRSDIHEVTVLRELERGILIRDRQTNYFFRWEDVASVSVVVATPDLTSRACRLSARLCFPSRLF